MNDCSPMEDPNSMSFRPFHWGPHPADSDSVLPTSHLSQKSESTNLLSTGSYDVPNSSAFQSTFGSDGGSSQDPGHNVNTTVVEPYEIEEPDDDYDEDNNVDDISLACKSEDGTASFSSDTVGHSQEDLVDSMQGLDCRSGTSRIRIRPGQKRGQKRRPSGSATISGFPRSNSWTASNQGNTSKCEAKYVGPKRLRKQRTKSKRDLLSSHETFSSQILDGGLSPRTSSSSGPSTETSAGTSATETGNETTDADADAMDVD